MDPHSTRLETFIIAERDRYATDDSNLFASALAQVARYERFLRIILARHHEVASEYVARVTENMERMRQRGAGPRLLTPEEIAEADYVARLTTSVHLEVESFYLFAKIFLDQVARFIEHNFGSERSLSIDSHDELTKHFARYAAAKELQVPPEFLDGLVDLKMRIADFRDYQIAHARNPRMMRATVWGADRQPRMAFTPLYPRGKALLGEQKESESLERLMQAVDKHTEGLIELIIENRPKSRYRQESV